VIVQNLEKAVRVSLRKRKQATTEQIFESIRETYPDSSKYRVHNILKKSSFATRQVRENDAKWKTGVYRRMMPVWVYKPIRKRKRTTRKHETTQVPERISMDVIWPRLVFRGRLQDELKHIREELNDTSKPKAIDYKVWIERNPEEKFRLIADKREYDAIQDFMTTLDARNNYQRDKMCPDERYMELTEQCIEAYEGIAATSFFR
jgi:hypothetical protein